MLGLSLKELFITAAEIIIPMFTAQLICNAAAERSGFAKRLMPTAAKRILWLVFGIMSAILILGAAFFILQAGVRWFYISCGAAVGVITGLVTASIGDE